MFRPWFSHNSRDYWSLLDMVFESYVSAVLFHDTSKPLIEFVALHRWHIEKFSRADLVFRVFGKCISSVSRIE